MNPLTRDLNTTKMTANSKMPLTCDPETGLCVLPETETASEPVDWKDGEELIYIGDPMCSWCWGISPALQALGLYGRARSIPLTMVMGGLRPGGGEEWNGDFKQFLKHHWQEVNSRSGQPFGFELFNLDEFDYDTEPACRAAVTARHLLPARALSFYELIHYRFYVKSQDPKQVSFYQPICEQIGIDYESFADMFDSEEMKAATQHDFLQARKWGVNGFPTVLYRQEDQLYAVTRGYSSYEEMKTRIESIA